MYISVKNLFMREFLYILILISYFLTQVVLASDYSIYDYDKYNIKSTPVEKVLFILDFSNSMNELVEGRKKVDLMLDTMKKLLPSIDPHTVLGLRVYGHRISFTPFESCRASKLVVPLQVRNAKNIYSELSTKKPMGMTPITYSLKQAIIKDFMGINGKKRIVLLTDGGENCDESPCDFVIELIKTRGDIFIDVIAFNIIDKDDLDQLKCTALVTRGKFYTADTSAELIKSLSDSLSIKKNVEAKIILNK